MSKMNKTGFIKELSEKLGYDEDKGVLINSVIEDHFILSKNNKEEILEDLMEKVGVSQEEADKIYDVAMGIIAKEIKDKILHPFKKNK